MAVADKILTDIRNGDWIAEISNCADTPLQVSGWAF